LKSLLRTAKEILRGGKTAGQDRPGQASAPALLESAFRLHRSGRLSEAQSLYRSAVAIDPLSDVAHNLLGAVLCAQGQVSEGEICFRTALDINASNVEALNNLASAHKDRGDLPNAETFYLRALELRPDFSAAWNNLGLVHLASGRRDDADRCFRRAISADARNADAHNNLGAVLRTTRPAEAEVQFRSAIAANPALAEGWCGLGDVLTLRGLLDEAESCCRKALELKPGYADATNNLATIAKQRERLDVAKAYCVEVLQAAPRHVGALNNLGNIAARQLDYTAAERIYRDALRIDPCNGVTRFNLATTLLMQGNYDEGFELYESRFEAFQGTFPRSSELEEKIASRPRWRGEALGSKRLLLWGEQGLGDCIMMLRYLSQLSGRGVANTVVVCDASLVRLVREMSFVEHVVTLDRISDLPEFDAHCPMMSLPAAFGSSPETIPDRIPYVAVPRELIDAWRERLNNARPHVGIAWAGSRTLREDARRSIPLARFLPLLSQDCVQFISLQKGDASEEWRKLGRDGGSWIDACGDFLDTAALMMNLDLVISVDTAVAHLAGALGRPVWLLNRFGSEWRWGLEGTATRWYPSMKIFREPAPGNWDVVISEVTSNLRSLAR
jgi:Tfp pilus assembly protein PilF